MIYTIGYSRRAIDDLERIIGDNILLDIRLSARSRQPGYSAKALKARFGDAYEHVYEFGNINYLAGGEIQIFDPELGIGVLDAFLHDAPGRDIFLMCACQDAKTCHRSTVAAMLRERGYEVQEWQD